MVGASRPAGFLTVSAVTVVMLLAAVFAAPSAWAAAPQPQQAYTQCLGSGAGNSCAEIYSGSVDDRYQTLGVGMVQAASGHGICILNVRLYINGTPQNDGNKTKRCSYSGTNVSSSTATDSCPIPDTPRYVTRNYVTHLQIQQDGGTPIIITSKSFPRNCGR